MLGHRRRRTEEQIPTEVLLARVRAARARKSVARSGSPTWATADEQEKEAIAELKRQFGVENVTPQILDWLLTHRR